MVTSGSDTGAVGGDPGEREVGEDLAATGHGHRPMELSDPRHPARFGPGGSRRRRSRWIAVGSVAGVVALLTAVFGFGLSRDPSIIRSPLIGRRAPAFALPTLREGRIIRLADLRGQVLVINFWASWCSACRVEHPNLLAAWQRYRDQGVVVLGIDYQDNPSAAMAFMRQLGGDWPVVSDPGSRTAIEYGVYGVPETFFVDRAGVIRFKRIGPSSYALLTDEIQKLLASKG